MNEFHITLSSESGVSSQRANDMELFVIVSLKNLPSHPYPTPPTPPHHTPTKAYYMLVPEFEKHPLFADFGRQKIWTEIADFEAQWDTPFLNKSCFCVIYDKVPFFVKVRITVSK